MSYQGGFRYQDSCNWVRVSTCVGWWAWQWIDPTSQVQGRWSMVAIDIEHPYLCCVLSQPFHYIFASSYGLLSYVSFDHAPLMPRFLSNKAF